jgi:hypothetical protein
MAGHGSSSFIFQQEDCWKLAIVSGNRPITGFSWSNNRIGYVLAEAEEPEILHPPVSEVHRQVNISLKVMMEGKRSLASHIEDRWVNDSNGLLIQGILAHPIHDHAMG